MAEYDGSIRINTKLDNTGFKKDSAELKDAIESFKKKAEQVNSTLKGVAAGPGTGKAVQDFKSLQKAASDVVADVKKLGTASKTAMKGSVDDVRNFNRSANGAKSTINDLVEKLKEYGNSRIKTDRYKQLIADTTKLEKSMRSMYERQAKMEALGTSKQSRAYKSLAYDIEQAEIKQEHLYELQEKMEADGSAYRAGSTTEGYGDTMAALQSAQAQIDIMRDSVAQAQIMHSTIEQTMGEITTGTSQEASAVRETTQEVGFLQSAAQGVRRAFEGLRSLPGLAQAGAVKAVSAAATGLKTALHAAAGAAKTLVTNLASITARGLKSAASAALDIGKNLGRSALQMISLKRQTGGADQAMGKLLHSVTSVWSMLRRRLIRSFISSIIRGAKEGMQNLALYSDSVNQTISRLMSALYQLKNSFATAFAPILSVVAPILQTLINYLSTAATYVGMFVAALTGKKSFTKAKAVQVDYAKSLQSTADDASSAADSVSDVGDAAEDAAERAEEAAKNIESFDDVTILEDNSDKDDGGKSSSGRGAKTPSTSTGTPGMPDIADMFEEVPIDSKISDLAQKIKDLIAAQDWEGLGKFLADNLNKIVQKIHDFISWDNLGDKLTKYIDAICRTFNAFVDNVDWQLIGDTVAEGINTILHCLDLLLIGIDWRNLGKSFAEGLNGLIDGVDWPLLGKTLGDYLNAWADLVNGFVHEFHWADLGNNFAEGLNSLFKTVHWQTIADDIKTGINGVISMISAAVTGFKWHDAAVYLAQGLNTALSFDWSAAGTTLAQAINGVLTFLRTAIQEFNWKDLGHNIMSFLTSTIGGISWGDVGGLISDAFKAVLDFFIGAIEGFDWGKAGSTLYNGVKDFITNIDWPGVVSKAFELLGAEMGGLGKFLIGIVSEAWTDFKEWISSKFEETGGDGIAGFFKGIGEALKDVGKWIIDHIFNPFIKGFKDAFGIHSPSTVMAEQGGFLIEGLHKGISEAWGTITEFFGKAWETITGTVGEAATNIKAKAAEMATGAKEKLTELATSAGEKAAEYKEKLATAFGEAGENVRTKAGEIRDAAGEKLASMAETAGEKASAVKEWLANAFGGARDDVATKAGEISTTVSENFTGMAGTASAQAAAIRDGLATALGQAQANVSSVFGTMFSTATEKLDGIAGAVSQKLGAAASEARSKADSVRASIASGFSAAKEAASSRASEILATTKDRFTGMASTAKERADNVKSTVSAAFNEAKNAVSSRVQEIASNTRQRFSEAASDAKEKSEAAKDGTASAFSAMLELIREALQQIRESAQDGFEAMQESVRNGMGQSSEAVETGSYSMSETMRNNMEELRWSVDSIDWSGIGENICYGIEAGMNAGWGSLSSYAWNMATDLLDTAKSALGIWSPSHEFRDKIGRFIPLGISEGMERTAPQAYKTITGIAEDLVDAAEGSKPILPLSIDADGISGPLETVADHITDTFTRLIDTLQSIAGSASFTVPTVATGSVIPYSAGRTTAARGISTAEVESLTRALSASRAQSPGLTVEDLRDLLLPLFQTYCTTVIGDETIARHAAAGQASLDRRYGTA